MKPIHRLVCVKSRRLLVSALCALLLVASSAYAQEAAEPEAPVKPPTYNISGPWCGVVNDQNYGSGQINLSVIQKGKNLSGTWSNSLDGFGTFTGKINGAAITVTMRDKASKCGLAVNGSLISDSDPDTNIAGSYAQFGCHQADGGTFDLERCN
jgi:hypothetical protein